MYPILEQSAALSHCTLYLKEFIKIIINYITRYTHILYFVLSSLREIRLIFRSYLASPISTSTSTVHKLIESMIVLLATFTESTIPASNISTNFYCFKSYPSQVEPYSGLFSLGTYCISFLRGCFSASASTLTPY